MRARLTSSHIVGRVSELAELELAWHEASARRPALVLLGGDSGVGKTRLIAEFERRVVEDDDVPPALVLRGEAVEQGDGELPYAPLLSALRPLVRDRHPVLEALSAGSRAELAALLPSLGAGRGGDRPDPGSQLRLFEALIELLDLLSEPRPAILILEDIHWADRSTRAFIAFVARSLRDERVAVVLSFRTDELHRRHPLRPLLAELERLERVRRVDLSPLDRLELAEVLDDILGAPPGQPLIDRIYARSEGNPLYTEELLAAGLDGRGAPPQSLRDAFLLRLERLSADAQRAVRAIAVGRRLDERLITELTGMSAESLNAPLREALAEQVLLTDEDGRFGFRHALLREVVYDDLLPGERGELHLALARALEAMPVADEEHQRELTASVARHYAAAGDQPAALRATVQAAIAACRVHARGEVADMAERALELWPRVPDAAEISQLDHVGLLVLAADAERVDENRSRSEVLLQSALRELDPERDRRRYAEVLGSLAKTQWTLNRGLEGVETAQRALALLPEDERTPERGALLAWVARTLFLRGRFREALADGEAALDVAVAVEDSETESEALNTLGMTRIALGEVEHGVQCLRRAIEIARAHDDPEGVGYAYANLADLLSLRGHITEALATAREGLEAIPRRLTLTRDWLLLTLSEREFDAGDWPAARQHLGPDPSALSGIRLLFRLLREAELTLGEGDDETAERCLEQAEPLVAGSSEPQWIGAFGALLGELRRRQGDLEAARSAVGHALDRIELCTDDVMRIARVTAIGARVEADAAQRGRDLGAKRAARDAIARARIHVDRLRAIAQEGGPVEKAWAATAVAELSRARSRSDARLWKKAAGAWQALERPYQVASAQYRQAEALIEAGDRDQAASVAAEALETARALGAGWLEGEVSALADRARLEVRSRLKERARLEGRSAGSDEAGEGPDARARPEPEDPFGLTPRERQVLALIAQGATNRQIGAALYMAEKTASVHVSRILAKLGVQTRTQAAAVAHRMHLSTAAH